MFFKKKEKTKKNEPKLVAAIFNTVDSEIYQDMLKNNGIPFICNQLGAGGFIKIATGSLLVTDRIYVNEEDYEKAKELFDLYIERENSEVTVLSEEQ